MESLTSPNVELGRYLFFDQRRPVNGKESCARCHKQELAFIDGRARAKGTTGELHPRSSMSLMNVAYSPSLTWDNPAMRSLEEQALIPIFGTEPVELGLKGSGEHSFFLIMTNLHDNFVCNSVFKRRQL